MVAPFRTHFSLLKMKTDLHPTYHKTKVTCACGAKFEFGSTMEEYTVEICSKCHPFYTGKQKLVDTAGRVDKFRARMEVAKKRKEEEDARNKAKNKKESVEEKMTRKAQEKEEEKKEEKAKKEESKKKAAKKKAEKITVKPAKEEVKEKKKVAKKASKKK